jgi:hypothetical protein
MLKSHNIDNKLISYYKNKLSNKSLFLYITIWNPRFFLLFDLYFCNLALIFHS